MSDYRDTAHLNVWWKSYNEDILQAEAKEGIFDEDVIAFEFIVCPTCRGKGSYVNPSIDSHGITSDEWNEWEPEERSDYMSGAYDVICGCCGGKRVVPEPIEEDQIKQLQEHFNELAEYEAERESERRMGC